MRLAVWICAISFCCCHYSLAKPPALVPIAGTGSPENNGDSGPATKINIGEPFGVEVGSDGALYVTEVRHHRIRRVDLESGEITTVAGCGRRGYSGDGGLAVEAELNEPYEVRFDRDGNMYFVEMQNHVIRRVDHRTKLISTVAGTGQPGFSGDGEPAIEAQFRQPHSIALDADAAIYVADIGNHRIRRIDPVTGIIDSVAGNSERKLPTEGQMARGNQLLGPRALCMDDQTLWIALREGHSIWRMDLSKGTLHHVAGTGKAGFAGDGGPAKEAQFNGPKGIAVDAHGGLYIADTENDAIRKIDLKSGLITTIAGSSATPSLNRPHGVCVGPNGEVYIGDTLNHRVWKVQ